MSGAGLKTDFVQSYKEHLADLLRSSATERQALEQAVGGEFVALGLLELACLQHYGLEPDHYLIDVGCGSGRLAKPLTQYLGGRYLGTDVVPELLSFAKKLCGRPDWRFEKVTEIEIPEHDSRADMVCFFSVLTHLLHEDSYLYLSEAKRVLRPGGRIVFSFVEFALEYHWHIFEGNLRNAHKHLNQFIGRDAIQAWARHLGLRVEGIHDGDKPHFPVPFPIQMENGTLIQDRGTIGQSVCVLVKD